MGFTDKVQEEIARYLAIGLIGLLLFVLAAIWILPSDLLPNAVISWLDGYATGKTLLRLILLIGGLVAWVIYLRPFLIFDKRVGAFRDLKTGIYYCMKCKTEKRIKAPMLETPEGWQCQSCGHWYNNPDYEKPPKSPKPPMPQKENWITRYKLW